MRSSFTIIASGQSYVISGEGLTVEVVGADKPETAQDEPAAAVETAGEYLREAAATVPIQIIREGVAPRETGRFGGDASCPDTDSHSSRRSSPVTDKAGEAVPPLATSPATNSPSRAARGPRENAMNESATDMRASAHCQPAGSNSRITSPAKIQAKTLEQSIRLLRPGCRHPDNTALCGGNGRRLCRDCAIQSEAAA